ncbi:hypothetical protein M9Y10_011823 [Tritrichomonas musculus]|uniref:Uncharacterized protein n=1 Tax=Tritrichomonas musculus TaxID=1915356 RepID=A0ABR2IAY8_9EUKA
MSRSNSNNDHSTNEYNERLTGQTDRNIIDLPGTLQILDTQDQDSVSTIVYKSYDEVLQESEHYIINENMT